ncbi:MAG: hypothetical protein IJQ82_09915 [Selenomonadaceae bacterium]|nr:hypothetical protein [Selenomonadaceae bacterium]
MAAVTKDEVKSFVKAALAALDAQYKARFANNSSLAVVNFRQGSTPAISSTSAVPFSTPLSPLTAEFMQAIRGYKILLTGNHLVALFGTLNGATAMTSKVTCGSSPTSFLSAVTNSTAIYSTNKVSESSWR